MPKRKRGSFEEGGDRAIPRRKHDVEEKITQARKVLHRALKAAKGFERQRLGKRLNNARTQGNNGDVQRINKEIEVLKTLDLAKVGEAHLRKTLLKIKAFADSELLPEEMRAEVEKPDMGEDDLKAWNNVLSGMFNMKALKEAVSQIVDGLYISMGVPAPVGKPKGKGAKEPGTGTLNGKPRSAEAAKDMNVDLDPATEVGSDEPAWEGFDSGDEQNSDMDPDEEMDIGSDEDLDEEDLSRYDALLGGSSDEESFDEEQYKSSRASNSSKRLSLSLSPSPSSASESQPAPSPPPKAAKAKKPKPAAAPAKIGGSTFLPTLMGGYYEGSDSAGSDIEQDVVKNEPVKKNRPGQMARQAIWEKKFGRGANHIKQGLAPVAERTGRDAGWDAKRGAQKGGARGRPGGSRGGGQQRGRASEGRATGDTSTAIGERKRGMGKKDDVGVLHPSWQAAKKAKEMKKSAAFQGKKVVFD
jgi:hypothetical protein